MRITTIKTDNYCAMIFWIVYPNNMYMRGPIEFRKKNDEVVYTIYDWMVYCSFDKVTGTLIQEFPEMDESMIIDDALAIMLQLKYGWEE